MKRKLSTRLCLVACALLVAMVSGCGREGADAAIARVNSTNIQRLANLYFSFQMKNGWRGPDDEAEFKKFLSSYNTKKLSRIGIDPNAIDEVFINERDRQPFKIRYSVPGSIMGSNEPVIFEAEGVRGKRLVGFLNMEQREVDEAEYDDLWSGKIKPAEAERDAQRRS